MKKEKKSKRKSTPVCGDKIKLTIGGRELATTTPFTLTGDYITSDNFEAEYYAHCDEMYKHAKALVKMGYSVEVTVK